MFKSTSTSLILLGVLAIIVGIIALAWPGVTVLALVILFAVDAFTGAGLQLARAFSSRTAGPVFGYLLLTLAGLAAGDSPGLARAHRAGPGAGRGGSGRSSGAASRSSPRSAAGRPRARALFILGGLVSIAFGVVIFARPNVGAVTLALLFGLFSLVYGVSQITTGVELRRAGQTLDKVLDHAA